MWEYWNSAHWDIATLECRDIVMSEHWDVGTLRCRDIGMSDSVMTDHCDVKTL